MGNCGNCGNVLKPGGGCGCLNCPPSEPGEDGAAGLSAYEIWLQEGNVGDEQDFLDSLVGPPGEDGDDGVPTTKLCFYDENISEIEVSSGLPDPTIYHFPTGYGVLTYTNTSGVPKDFIVHASYDCKVAPDNVNFLYNVVHGAIIKTVLAVDSVEYQNIEQVSIVGSLMNGPGVGDFVNRLPATDDVETTVGDPVEFRYQIIDAPYNVAFFKKVTLEDGESVSLKFKSPEPGIPSTLLQAQMFVLEL